MRSKRIPPFVSWLVAGAVLFIISGITHGTRVRIFAIGSFAAAFLWFLFPNFMKMHSHKLYGIWLILVGLYFFFIVSFMRGDKHFAGMDGLFLIVLGIGFLIIT